MSEPRSTGFENSKSPTTDWSLQSSAPVMHGSSAGFSNKVAASRSTPRLWTLSQGFFEAEAKREYRLEALLFAVVTALAAWPIGSALYMVSETIR